MVDRSGHLEPTAVRLIVRDDPDSVAAVRAYVERVATAVGLPEADVFDLKLATSEAVANALCHPERDDEGVEVTLAARAEALEIEVENGGPFRVGGALDPERGRGLPLMLALADEVEFASSERGTRVRLRKLLEHEAA